MGRQLITKGIRPTPVNAREGAGREAKLPEPRLQPHNILSKNRTESWERKEGRTGNVTISEV